MSSYKETDKSKGRICFPGFLQPFGTLFAAAMAKQKLLKLIPALHHATHSVSVFLDRHSALGVTQAEAHILTHLWAEGESTVGQLHGAFGHRRSTLTSILDRLADRGLISRKSSETDRRTFIIALTTQGVKTARDAYKVLHELESSVFRSIPRSGVEGFIAVAAAISRHGSSH